LIKQITVVQKIRDVSNTQNVTNYLSEESEDITNEDNTLREDREKKLEIEIRMKEEIRREFEEKKKMKQEIRQQMAEDEIRNKREEDERLTEGKTILLLI